MIDCALLTAVINSVTITSNKTLSSANAEDLLSLVKRRIKPPIKPISPAGNRQLIIKTTRKKWVRFRHQNHCQVQLLATPRGM